jgi:photosystem II stability/assembly factor-like uncharacterized protein
MKRKHLLFSTFSIVLIVGALLTTYNHENNYNPRKLYSTGESYFGAAEYYTMLKVNPETGIVDGELIKSIEENARAFNSSKNGSALNLTWDEVGPDNIGGRTRAILIVREDLMFAGSVSGGLFKSTNGGNTWERVPGFDKNYSISTMARLDNGHLYIGTGNTHDLYPRFLELGEGGSGSIGGGLFVSTDEGITWKYAKDGDGNDIKPASISIDAEYSFFDKIVADPSQENKLWVGYNKALKPYVEGQGFGDIPDGLPVAGCEDVEISSDGTVIVASVNSSNGYVSNNSGSSFTLISGSEEGQLPDSLVRLEFAVSPDDENYVYAAIAVPGFLGKFDGVYSSTDKGNTWSRIWLVTEATDPDPTDQAFYSMAISVPPGHKNSVMVGAFTVWSAGNFEIPAQRSTAFYQFFLPGNDLDPLAVHADVHTFAWAEDGTLYIGTDGGISRSEDMAETFIDANRFYSVTQFYSVGYSANDLVIGGAQDNGPQYMAKKGSTPQESYSTLRNLNFGFGDGFDCEISNLEPEGNVLFFTLQFNLVMRSFDGGLQSFFMLDQSVAGLPGPFHSEIRLWESKTDFNNPNTVKYTNETDNDMPAGTEVPYNSNSLSVPLTAALPIDLSPGDTTLLPDPVSSLFSIGYGFISGVWVTRGALVASANTEYAQVIDSLDGTVTSQEWSKEDGDILYVGTSAGSIYRISGFADAYSIEEMSLDSALYKLKTNQIYTGNAPILDIAVDAKNADHLVAARGGFGGSEKVIESFDAASADSPSFNNIWFTTGSLVGLPAYACVIDGSDPNVILVGTEFGIYSTEDGGNSWGFEGEDPMGSFPVYDLRQQWRSPSDVENAGYIYVGSHGRGAFKSSSLQKNGIDEVVEEESNNVVENLMIAPNPMSSFGKLEFTTENEGVVTMDIYSIAGQKVKTLKFAMKLGSNSYRFDVSDLDHGTYIIKLNKDNKVTTKKFVIIR